MITLVLQLPHGWQQVPARSLFSWAKPSDAAEGLAVPTFNCLKLHSVFCGSLVPYRKDVDSQYRGNGVTRTTRLCLRMHLEELLAGGPLSPQLGQMRQAPTRLL
jgi:hypothetical protein